MFTYIKLKNYKSLIELEVDLTKKENTPKKLISIYGENGVGKSNFVDSFYTLKRIVSTRTIIFWTIRKYYKKWIFFKFYRYYQ